MASDVTVTPDQVSIGVLVSSIPRDVIDVAVAACGVGPKRSGGTLRAHVVAYLTLALCLFPDDDYTEVATKVTGSLDRWIAGTRPGPCRPPRRSPRLANAWAATCSRSCSNAPAVRSPARPVRPVGAENPVMS